MIKDFKIFEDRYNWRILPDKKFYVFALPKREYTPERVAVIEIVYVNRLENRIYLICIKTDALMAGSNFFTYEQNDWISFKTWKNNKDYILFKTDDKEEAIKFYDNHVEVKIDSGKFGI